MLDGDEANVGVYNQLLLTGKISPRIILVMGWRYIGFGEGLCVAVWVVMTLMAWLVPVSERIWPQSFGFIAHHGKTLNSPPQSTKKSLDVPVGPIHRLSAWLRNKRVHKPLFIHMYVVGTVMGLIVLTKALFADLADLERYITLISLTLFLIQVVRRLWECIFITSYGSSTMHISGYLIGLIHYITVPWTLYCTTPPHSSNGDDDSFWIQCGCAILLFAVANWGQYVHHLILYQLKLQNHQRHALPKGAGFKYVCCPHYSMEILVYVSFYLLNIESVARLSLLVWVISNLSIVADENHVWYHSKFSEDIPSNWKRLIPFFW